MRPDPLFVCLRELESINFRQEGACSCGFTRLSDGDSLLDALMSHLSGRGKYKAEFPLELGSLAENWLPTVEALVTQWVWGLHSPPNEGGNEASLVIDLTENLRKTIGECTAFEVVGAGTMLPDVVWHAIAFTNGSENWLLEFGWSD